MGAPASPSSGAAPPSLHQLRVATQLLTRLPVGRLKDPGDDLTRASAWFPLVGAIVAALGIGVRALLEPFLGVAPATVAAVLATVVVTGAFHEDGLADCADGFWGGLDRGRRLEIMRDSRLGTYGVCALVGDLALRIALLASLPLGAMASAMLAAHVLGRAAPLALVAWLPPARSEGNGTRTGGLGVAGWVAAGTTSLIAALIAAGTLAPVLLAVAALAVVGVGLVARAKLGGVTGDVLGAGVRVSALLVTAAVVVMETGVS